MKTHTNREVRNLRNTCGISNRSHAADGRNFAGVDIYMGKPGASRLANPSQSYRDAYDALIARSMGPVLIATQAQLDSQAALRAGRGTGPRAGWAVAAGRMTDAHYAIHHQRPSPR